MTGQVEFCGELFTVAEKVGLMPLMRFAKVAQRGTDSHDMAGLAAIYDVLEQCFADDGEWDRFQDVAAKHRADADDLLAVIPKVMELLTARPTSRPSDSSDGPQTTSPRSEGGSSRAEELLAGRPDLQVVLYRQSLEQSA